MPKLLQESLTVNRYMDISNKNELQPHQGMKSRNMHKSQLFWQKIAWESTLLIINIVTNDRLTCNVNKVHMILGVSIYAFLITIGLFI